MGPLTRDTYESFMIGDDVEITVLEIKGNTVKLGVSAPSDMSATHSEVYAKLKFDSYMRARHEQCQS